jgi:23S rRNA pseudouridine2605 synthase
LPAKPPARLYPVGRLDADSEGLLLLTNDGALTERITHPRYGLQKEYEALIEGTPTVEDLARLRAGIPLDGKSAQVDLVELTPGGKGNSQLSVLRITVHEGRKHEIRRLCEAIGHPVRHLRRVRLGPLLLAGLAPGDSRPLTELELTELRRLTGLQPARRERPAATRDTGGKQETRQQHTSRHPGRAHDHASHATADHNH